MEILLKNGSTDPIRYGYYPFSLYMSKFLFPKRFPYPGDKSSGNLRMWYLFFDHSTGLEIKEPADVTVSLRVKRSKTSDIANKTPIVTEELVPAPKKRKI